MSGRCPCIFPNQRKPSQTRPGANLAAWPAMSPTLFDIMALSLARWFAWVSTENLLVVVVPTSLRAPFSPGAAVNFSRTVKKLPRLRGLSGPPARYCRPMMLYLSIPAATNEDQRGRKDLISPRPDSGACSSLPGHRFIRGRLRTRLPSLPLFRLFSTPTIHYFTQNGPARLEWACVLTSPDDSDDTCQMPPLIAFPLQCLCMVCGP
ncbi:hypothetical protein BC834DRAFT_91625 [Gloeopeniophorella convolvens]|nr:hypothetical protein BC834DRAFT_91625 [Gloeopeniophorella convolvens]